MFYPPQESPYEFVYTLIGIWVHRILLDILKLCGTIFSSSEFLEKEYAPAKSVPFC
jgi:hypothetical protein